MLCPPTAIAFAQEGGQAPEDWPIETVPPAQLITHEKGSLHWTNLKPLDESTYTVEATAGDVSLWDHKEEYYWPNAFKVVGDYERDVLPEFTARFDAALSWVNPKTGTTDPLDFECHFKALKKHDASVNTEKADPEVRMLYANGFYIVGIEHAQVTYKFYDHESGKAIDPGLLDYWCRSLNPGECVGFSRSANEGLELTATYLTDKGLYDKDFVNADTADRNRWLDSSVVVDKGDDLIKFTGANYLQCGNGVQVDIADSTEAFLRGCTEHGFETPAGGSEERPDYIVHGVRIPYEEYVQYRAVTFEFAPGGDPDAGLTLDYFSRTQDFYWDMEFNGIMVTRHLPTKVLLPDDGELPLPGDEVTFAVNQSLDDIPAGLVSELVFQDELDKRFELMDAKMFVGDDEVTGTAGKLACSGNTVTYSFSKDGLEQLAYGPDGSECTLHITAKVKDTVDFGDRIPNVATVTMNEDEADTPEVVVTIGPKPDPDIEVDPGPGILAIEKTVEIRSANGIATVGDPLYYLIHVQNIGNSPIEEVKIQDSIPQGIVITSTEPKLMDQYRQETDRGECHYWEGNVTPDGGIVQIGGSGRSGGDAVMTLGYSWAGTIQAHIPYLASGDSVYIGFDAAVAENATATVTNVALAMAPGDYKTVEAEASFEVRDPPESSGSQGSGGANQGAGTTGGNSSGGGNQSGTSSGGGSSGGTSGNGSSGGNDPNNPSDADNPPVDDPDNSGGGGSTSPGNSGGGGSAADGAGGSGGTSGSAGDGAGTGGDLGGSGGVGGTSGNYPTGTIYPASDTVMPNGGATTMANQGDQRGTATSAKRPLPQTDAPPVIGIATTCGIGMTTALVAHTVWNTRNRRR